LSSELAREKMWARIHLIPALQAEEDRDLVRRHLADQAREKALLGENIKVYHSDRYVPFLRVVKVCVWVANGLTQICPPYLCCCAGACDEVVYPGEGDGDRVAGLGLGDGFSVFIIGIGDSGGEMYICIMSVARADGIEALESMGK